MPHTRRAQGTTSLHAHYAHLEHGLLGSFRRLPLLVACCAAGWLIEGRVLYITAAAGGVPVSMAGALLVALAAALLTTVLITPAGLGLEEPNKERIELHG